MKPRARNGATRDRILDLAQRLIQSRGYNAFSFHDLAKELGIRTASIHYHFPTKADLGVALLQRYRDEFRTALSAISAAGGPPLRHLDGFAGLFERTFKADNQLCLCGMLSAEVASLPKAVAQEVQGFFTETERWLANVLATGRKTQSIIFAGSPRNQARMLLAMLEGAMVVARGMRRGAYFKGVARSYLTKLKAA
jgi:TetR/AcrR family transcriptional repressor of nem operon